MRQILFFALIMGLTPIACKKLNTSCPTATSLDGKWRMVSVKDNTSGLITTKPATIQNDVDITFTFTNQTTGSFTGNTPTNDIVKNDCSIGTNQTITIPALAMTKVAETSWGILFVDNIRASREYNFGTGGLLNITTTNKTLSFRKL
ncbi:MAG: hypothetical protein Q8926_03860 [Bacteroidota bacterium]|nr:hypothetical protein [Bacteroidota bacterium]